MGFGSLEASQVLIIVLNGSKNLLFVVGGGLNKFLFIFLIFFLGAQGSICGVCFAPQIVISGTSDPSKQAKTL
jgi:hypothetical protein